MRQNLEAGQRQAVAIFRQTGPSFRQRKLWLLKIKFQFS